MSSFIIAGFFALAEGQTISIPKAGRSTKSKYHVYSTVIQTSQGEGPAAELRVFAWGRGAILPDETVAFVVGRAAIDAAHGVTLIEANEVLPVRGHPNDVDYDDHIPDLFNPIAVVLGTVSSPPAQVSDSSPDEYSAFHVNVSDYVRDTMQKSVVKYELHSHTISVVYNDFQMCFR
jgi:hypothetical protein